jgi:hypothetical protein
MASGEGLVSMGILIGATSLFKTGFKRGNNVNKMRPLFEAMGEQR